MTKQEQMIPILTSSALSYISKRHIKRISSITHAHTMILDNAHVASGFVRRLGVSASRTKLEATDLRFPIVRLSIVVIGTIHTIHLNQIPLPASSYASNSCLNPRAE